MNKSAILIRTAVVSALCLPAGIAAAQQLEEIVVTAQKRAENIQNVGITIDAFSGDAIRDRRIESAEDMAQITPGLIVSMTGVTGVPNYTLRGVGFDDYSTSASSTVGLYVDEVSIPYLVASRGAVFDVDHVEVLKGPQGDLYGRNTTAGQISFVSRKPTKDFEAAVEAGYSRYDLFDSEGYASGSLGDSVQGRVSYKYEKSNEGWQQSLSRPGDTLGRKDVIALRGQLNFNLGDSGNLLLSTHFVKDRSDNQAATAYDGKAIGLPQSQNLPTIGTPNFSLGDNTKADWTPGPYYPKRDNQLAGGLANLSWDFGSMALTSITAFDSFTRTEGNDWDGSALSDSENVNQTSLSVFSEEVRLASKDQGPVSWIAGLYYSHDQMHEGYHYFMQDSYYALALGIKTLDTDYTQKTESSAAFGHVEWKFADQWKLVTGLRFNHETRDFTGCTYDSGDGTLAAGLNNIITPFLVIPAGLPNPGLVQPGGCGIYDDIKGSASYGKYAPYSGSIESNKVMWKLHLNWSPSDNLLVYGGASEGTKSGGFNGANANTQSQLAPYQPESLLAYELGLKSTLLNRTLQFNSSAFYYDYRNKQTSDYFITFVGAISGITNVPKSEIKGIDVDVEWAPVAGLNLTASAEYLDATVKEWLSVDPSSVYGQPTKYTDQAGKPLANSPKWQYNASANYGWSLPADLKAAAAVDYSYKGSTTGAQPFNATDAYGLLGARLSLGSSNDRWRATLWGKNLTDKYYWTAALVGGNGPYVRMLGMPRTYGVSVDYKFR